MAATFYHMLPKDIWRACQEQSKPYFPETYDQDGFIHLTADPHLLLTVANHFYRSSQGDWLVLVIDGTKLTAEVKFEPAAPVGNKSSTGLLGQQQGQAEEVAPAAEEPLFPHLYGTIPFDSVVQELPMQRGDDGSFLGIQGL